MTISDDLRDDAREWDISECPGRAARARAAADRIDDLEAQVREQGCKECADFGHHPRCDGYIPSIGELLGDY